MNPGYFHIRKKNNVLTICYVISRKHGHLKFSSSLWKKEAPQDNWCRKAENRNAYLNFREGPVTVKFDDINTEGLLLNDIWLKNYIHRYLCENGRKKTVIKDDRVAEAYTVIEECWRARGHGPPAYHKIHALHDGFIVYTSMMFVLLAFSFLSTVKNLMINNSC